MRPIDADELKKSAYDSEGWDGEGFHQMVVDVRDIDNAPTVEEFPVLRCKDCKHWVYGNRCFNLNDNALVNSFDPNFFCGFFERKDGNQNG